jgi:GTP pyrophosphokinase
MKVSGSINQIPQNGPAWLDYVAQHYPQLDQAALRKAYDFSENLSAQAANPYSIDTAAQGLRMASQLLDLNCDIHTITASLIYPSVFYAQPDQEAVEKILSKTACKLLSGATRLEAIHTMQTPTADSLNHQQIDNLRKMLLAIVDDIRIVLIKLVERLITLQYLKSCTPEQQRSIASQVMNFYAPLANRLGIGQLKWQLEDLAFRYLNPESYSHISNALNMRRSERELFIQQMMTDLRNLIQSAEIADYSLSGRAKHIYSIYRKAERKNLPISEIYDASALRVLVNNLSDCYTILSLVHDKWPHIPAEFDDYINNPKPNGYQSIHTAVTVENKLNVEIQIRTYHMHESAELGVAAHWKYKEGSSESESYEAKIERLRELMQWQQEVSEEIDPQLYQSLFSDRVYVFTPQGDVIDLPKGSTPLDFAYHIHTSIGHRTKGAKINEKMVPLTHILATGDRVSVITSKQEQPSRDWMLGNSNYLKTPQARQKVRHWFKKQNYQKELETGLELWDKASKQSNYKRQDLAKVTKRFNVKNIDDLLVAIGSGNLSTASILAELGTAERQPKEKTIPTTTTKPLTPSSNSALHIEGVGQLMTHLARCCKPIPGDAIIGFITQGRGISIHINNCANIAHQRLTQPHRIIEVNWGNQSSNSAYQIDIIIQAEDRSGLVRDISAIVAQEKLNFLAMNTQYDQKQNQVNLHVTIETSGQITTNKLLQQINNVPGVISIHRA